METEKTQLNLIPTIPEEEQPVNATADPNNHHTETPSQFNPQRENPHLQSDERPRTNTSNTVGERLGSA
jgi:hypothetical protein